MHLDWTHVVTGLATFLITAPISAWLGHAFTRRRERENRRTAALTERLTRMRTGRGHASRALKDSSVELHDELSAFPDDIPYRFKVALRSLRRSVAAKGGLEKLEGVLHAMDEAIRRTAAQLDLPPELDGKALLNEGKEVSTRRWRDASKATASASQPPKLAPAPGAAAGDLKALLVVTRDFVDELNALYGVYLDAASGFLAHHQRIVAVHAQPLPGVDDPDPLPYYIGRGAPTDPANVLQHTTTQGEYKRRNARGGSNYVQLGRMFVVMVFELWETGCRGRVADALGTPFENVTSDLFGDLRLLRNATLHRKGIIKAEESAKFRVLTGMSPGPFALTEDEIDLIARAAKAEMDRLVVEAGLPDPAYRTRWRLKTAHDS